MGGCFGPNADARSAAAATLEASMKSSPGLRGVSRRATVVSVVACALALIWTPGVASARPKASLTPEQHYVMRQLVAVYENSSPTPQYGYVQNLHDGCGYTAGWVGFCTATGDLLQVVNRYDSLAAINPMRKYRPELDRLATSGSARVDRLAGFPRAWRRAARDGRFRRAQNEVAERLYLQPAIGLARRAGLRSALAFAIFFETAVQHGTGPDPDGLPALIARTQRIAGGRAGAGISEASWLTSFNHVRLEDLLHPHNRARLADWPASADRARSDQRLVDGGYFNLSGRIPVRVFGDSFTLGR
jgi:chitosanase